MGYYRDRLGRRRYCNNPNHTHFWEESMSSGSGCAFAILNFIMCCIPVINIIWIIFLIVSGSGKKDEGRPSGWCK